MRRGCVWPMSPRSPRPSARQIFGSCVVLPDPVSPQTITTGFARDRGGDLVGALRDRQLRRDRRSQDDATRGHAAARPSVRSPPRSSATPARPRARGARARSGARARTRRRTSFRGAARSGVRRGKSRPCGGDGFYLARGGGVMIAAIRKAHPTRPNDPTSLPGGAHDPIHPYRRPRRLAGRARARRTRGRREDAALGRPRRHADDRSAFAEREPDQQHQPARSTNSSSSATRSSACSRRSPSRGRRSTRRRGGSSCARASSSTTARRSPPTTWCSASSARAPSTSQLRVYANASGIPKKIDDLHRRVHDQRPQPDRARAHRHDQHHEQGLVREEPRDQAAELHAEGGHDHRAPGERHRPVHARRRASRT